jgi:tripartite-type tricarboxylate transporter receptor subunit TctC
VPAQAQDYPTKPVRIITQGAAGSAPDVIARIVGDALSRLWGQQVLIVGRSGPAGAPAARAAASAPADGYTLYMPAASAFIIMPEMFPDLPFNLERDFVRVGFIGEQPMIIAAAPSLGVKTLPELVALTKQRPGQTFYAANARGTLAHLTAERFRAETGADLTHVPYPGFAAGLQDLIGGRIQVIVEGMSALHGAIQGGNVKALAVASAKRLPDLRDLPTVAERLPGFTATGWFALLAPAGTPQAVVDKVNADLNTILAQPDVQKRFHVLGMLMRPMTPQQTTDFIRSERNTWRPMVRQIGFSKR